ncbi:F-box only protein 25-like [Homo sapiens]|uniref:F-box only protein 25-like n=1 Tax=Homo sapiens TaxID=9606 RepID=UPI0007DC4EB4|nr:F-box only protein 25-like [Homo sapiens]
MKISLKKYFNRICLYFSILNSEEGEIFNNEEHEYASKKRKRTILEMTQILKRHGYCTLGEAFNRLDFSSAIQDIRRFNYVVKGQMLFTQGRRSPSVLASLSTSCVQISVPCLF